MQVYVKKNTTDFKNHLICEVAGLRRLKQYAPDGLRIPEILSVEEDEIEMEQIQSIPFDSEGWRKLGEGLAKMHRAQHGFFGLEEDNYIGLNPQKNRPKENWGRFFWEQRLLYQTKLIANPKLENAFLDVLERQKSKLVEALNAHSPWASPLHGDLWSGNILYDGKDPWLIDPAFYYGDREADLAMTKMFGGFGAAFYQAYDQELPPSAGRDEREAVYNLYHYLNHYNLFGAAYLGQVEKGFGLIERL